jgi:carbonic anhydrase
MRKKIRAAILSGVFMGMAGAAIACGDGEWGYSGAKGPDRWGYLKPE